MTIALLAALFISTTVFSQNQPSLVEILQPILEQAGEPLTEAQTMQLQSLQPGPEMQQQMVKILNERQIIALHQSSQQNQEPTMDQVLASAGNPLTDEQIEKINAIEQGPDARKQMMDILTDDQVVAMRNFMENDAQGANVPKVLKNGGEPLTVEQMRKMNSIVPGPEAEKALKEILTDSQNGILEDAMTEN